MLVICKKLRIADLSPFTSLFLFEVHYFTIFQLPKYIYHQKKVFKKMPHTAHYMTRLQPQTADTQTEHLAHKKTKVSVDKPKNNC